MNKLQQAIDRRRWDRQIANSKEYIQKVYLKGAEDNFLTRLREAIYLILMNEVGGNLPNVQVLAQVPDAAGQIARIQLLQPAMCRQPNPTFTVLVNYDFAFGSEPEIKLYDVNGETVFTTSSEDDFRWKFAGFILDRPFAAGKTTIY